MVRCLLSENQIGEDGVVSEPDTIEPEPTTPVCSGPPGSAEVVEELLAALPDWFAVTGRLSELVADQLGVGATDLECLHFLHQHGPASPGELARRVGRSTGAVTRMIDRLERGGFVQRRRSDQDRRGVQVEATPEGIDRIAAYFDDIAERSRVDLAHHSIRDLHLLLDFVRSSTASTTEQMNYLIDRTRRRGSSGAPVGLGAGLKMFPAKVSGR
jgi:DNA-binding MarR family transcriptional regulator